MEWRRKLAHVDADQDSWPTCFACGKENPIGLKLAFEKVGNEAIGEVTLSELYEGWYGVVHGGIVCTVLDEAMAYTYFPDTRGVTVKAEFRFRQPAPVGVPMVAVGRLVKRTRKLLDTTATLSLRDGTVIAEASARAYVVGSDVG